MAPGGDLNKPGSTTNHAEFRKYVGHWPTDAERYDPAALERISRTLSSPIERYYEFRDSDRFRVAISFQARHESAVRAGNQPKFETDVRLTCWRPVSSFVCGAWVVNWEVRCGDLPTSSAPWLGLQLVAFNGERIFVGLGTSVYAFDAATSDQKWMVSTGNTAVSCVVPDWPANRLYVLNESHGFKHGSSNLTCVSTDGALLWRADLPSVGNVYANPPVLRDERLVCSSWNCFSCEIDRFSGAIVSKVWTK